MAVPPRLPNLPAADMAWVRWATDELRRVGTNQNVLRTNLSAAQQQAAFAQQAGARALEGLGQFNTVVPGTPQGAPQIPDVPILLTDHGTVTIQWDGFVHANITYDPQPGDPVVGSIIEPAQGFAQINVYRGASATGPWSLIGGRMGRAGSIVDTNVVVGTTYWYVFETQDNLGDKSAFGVPASIVVEGVDLGTLASDVTTAITAAQAAGDAGYAAGVAGQAAADAANAAAATAESHAAAALLAGTDAQTVANAAAANASAALTSANGKNTVFYQTSAPSTSGRITGDTWFDTDDGYKLYVWNGTAWTGSPFGSSALGADSVTASQLLNGTVDATKLSTAVNASISTATSTANSKTTAYYQTSAPGTTGRVVGDLWFDTDDGYRIYVWNGTAWTSSQLGSGALSADSVTASQILNGTVDATKLATAVNTSITTAQSTATAAQNTANVKTTAYYQISAPSTSNRVVGDLWFDTDDGYRIYVWNGSAWTSSQLGSSALGADSVTATQLLNGTVDATKLATAVNTSITTAQSTATGAQNTANLKTTAYYQTSAPATTGRVIGDLWFDTDDGYKIYVWNGTAWTASALGSSALGADSVTATQILNGTVDATKLATAVNTSITTAQSTATGAQNTANLKTTAYYQISAPATTGRVVGDLWFDTDDGYRIYVWNGSAWTSSQLGSGALSADSVTATQILNGTVDATKLATAVNTSISTAQTTANGKNTVFYQTASPSTSGRVTGDIWFDTDDGYKIYVWNGTAWTASALGSSALGTDSVTATQLLNASVDSTKLSSAVNTSISTATSNASTALTAANGKNVITYSTSVPSNTTNPGTRAGDLWFVQDVSGVVTAQYTWTGSAWLSQTLTNSVIASLDAGKITTGTLSASRIGANSITAGMMVTGTITAASGILAAASITTATIADATITAAKISTIDAATITTGTLSAARIGAGTIDATKMVTGTITAASGILATASVTTAIIADATITAAKISSIDAGTITTGTLAAARIGAGTITATMMVAGTITAASGILATASVTTATIADATITAAKISSIDAGTITTGTLAAARIGAGTITATMMVAGTITAASGIIATAAITTAMIADATITAAKISSIDAGTITTGTLAAARIGAGTITATMMVAGTITAASGVIANLAITNAMIADATITSAKISAIDAGKITTGTLAAAQIGAGTIDATKMVTGTITAASGILASLSVGTAQIQDLAVTSAKVTALDAGKITTGTLIAAVIGANTIDATKMVAGTITAASGILADAVVTTAKIANLAVGTAQIANLAVSDAKIADLDANKIQAGTIVAGKLASNSVVTANIVAGNIDTNRLAAGAVTTDKLNVGVVDPAGTQINRIPSQVTDTVYWPLVIAGTPTLGGALGVTSTTSGLSFAASTTVVNYIYVVARTEVPQSYKIHITLNSTTSHVLPEIKYYTSAADVTGTVVNPTGPFSGAGATYTFPSTAYQYTVRLKNDLANVVDVVTLARIFEVVGSTVSSTAQATEISPAGLRLYYGGNPVIDLSTGSNNLLSIMAPSSSGLDTVASIDVTGRGNFATIAADTIYAEGTDLIGGSVDSVPNGKDWGSTALLDRAGRGVVYDATWTSMNATVVSTQYQRIAQDHFVLEDGRTYMVMIDLGGLQCANNTSGRNVYVELQFSTTALTSVTSGDRWSRAVLYSTSNGYWAFAPFTVSAKSGATASAADRILPSGVNIYWQINTNLSLAPTANYQLDEFGETRGLTVIDIGSTYLIRPSGGALPNATDRSTTGGASGTTTTVSTTTTWAASWSRSWNSSGSTIVSGTGQYTNGAALYQGNGASPMGSKFGFAALGLSGKTITNMQLYMKNTYVSYPGTTQALLGTCADTAAPATYTGARANNFNVAWGNGEGKWITVPSSLWAGFAAGTYRGFTLGVDSTNSQYGYWAGATMTNPPQIKITYQ